MLLPPLLLTLMSIPTHCPRIPVCINLKTQVVLWSAMHLLMGCTVSSPKDLLWLESKYRSRMKEDTRVCPEENQRCLARQLSQGKPAQFVRQWRVNPLKWKWRGHSTGNEDSGAQRTQLHHSLHTHFKFQYPIHPSQNPHFNSRYSVKLGIQFVLKNWLMQLWRLAEPMSQFQTPQAGEFFLNQGNSVFCSY